MRVCIIVAWFLVFFFVKQKTAYEMRISDWSSDVCSSDLDMDGVDGEPEKKRISGKRLIIFAAILLLVLIGGGVGAAFMLGMFAGGPPPVAEHADAPAVPRAQQHSAFFFEVPDQSVNLHTPRRQSPSLKHKTALELRS